MTCPPRNHNCNEGRTCPWAKQAKHSGPQDTGASLHGGPPTSKSRWWNTWSNKMAQMLIASAQRPLSLLMKTGLGRYMGEKNEPAGR